MMINNVVSFLPTFMESVKWTTDVADSKLTDDIALIIAMFSVAQIIFAPVNGTIKNMIGAKNTIIFGFSLLTVTTAGLGFLARIDDIDTFKYAACVLRFFQGQGDVLLQITGYSVVTSIYADDVMRYIGYIEICVGLGLGMGPVIGSAVYKALDYEGTMYMFAGFNLLGTLLCVCLIPNALNATLTEDEQAEIEGEDEEEIDQVTLANRKLKKVTLCTLMKDRSVMFALLTCFMGTFNLTFWSSWLAKDMADNMGFDQDYFGYVLATQSVIYLFGALLLPYTCESSPRRLQFFLATVGFSISIFMLGPSAFFGLPQNYWIVIASFPLQGLCQVFVFIPIIPEMLERLQVNLNVATGEDELIDAQINDKCNDAYGLIYALSMFVGPLIGSAMNTTFGSVKTCDYLGFANLGFAVLLFIFNCGPFVYAENRKFQERVAELAGEEEDEDQSVNTKDMQSLS